MRSYASITIFEDGDRLSIVKVQSSRCHYRVAVEREVVTVQGPGVREEYTREDLGENLPREALALVAVIHFEEEE